MNINTIHKQAVEELKKIIVSDKTNRFYIRTKKYPDGELFMDKECERKLFASIKTQITKAIKQSFDAVREYDFEEIIPVDKKPKNIARYAGKIGFNQSNAQRIKNEKEFLMEVNQ